jgi:hypothetical protein
MGWVTYPPLTPPVDVTNPPPLHDMDWQRFERLTVAIYAQEDGIATSDDYGLLGQSDHGVDVIARRAADGEEVASCKLRTLISDKNLADWSDEFFDHWDDHWKQRGIRRFVLATTATNTGDRKIQDQVSAERQRFDKLGIVYELWGPLQFAQKLSRHRDITARYLSPGWADILCLPAADYEIESGARRNTLSAAVVSQMAELQRVMSGQSAQRAQAAMNDLRAGRHDAVSSLVAELRGPDIWDNLEKSVQATILRLAAALALRLDDLEGAEALNNEAEAIFPAEEQRIASQIALEREGPRRAIEVLGPPISVAGKQALIAYQLMAGDYDVASALLAELEQIAGDNAETLRLAALSKLFQGDRAEALSIIRRAETIAGDWTAILHVGAVVRYAHSLSPTIGRDWLLYPNPVDACFVRFDEAVQPLLGEALALLARLDGIKSPHGEPDLWKLAVLANMRAKQAETRALAGRLLAADPAQPTVISWCLARQIDVDLDSSLAALKQRYGEKPDIYDVRVLGYALAALDRGGGAELLRASLPEDGPTREEALLWIARLSGEISIEEAADRLPLVLDAAHASGDWSEAAQLFDDALASSPPKPEALHIAQAAANSGQWSLLDGKADRLVEFETPAAVHLAAFSASRSGDAARCLDIIDRHGAVFGASLPPEIRRLRAEAHLGVGDISSALREADKVTSDTGLHSDQLFRAEIMAKIGNVRAGVAPVRQALRDGTIDPNYALHWAQLFIQEDPDLSRELWREAKLAGIDPRNSMAAMDQAFQLGLDHEAGDYIRYVTERAEAGAPEIQKVDLDQVREMMLQSQRAEQESGQHYLDGMVPAHLYVRGNSAKLIVLYLGETSSSTDRMLVRSTRHGARPADVRAGTAWRDWHIHLDVTALYEASRLGLLDVLERHPHPIRISPHLPNLLMETERRVHTVQKSRVDGLKRVMAALQASRMRVERHAPDGALHLGADERDGDRDMLRFAAGLAARGWIEADEVRRRIGPAEGGDLAQPFDLTGVGAVHLEYSELEELGSSDLLDLILAHFAVSISPNTREQLKEEHFSVTEQDRLGAVAAGLRQRIADGIQNGTYEFIRGPAAGDQSRDERDVEAHEGAGDEDEDEDDDEDGHDLLVRQLRDLLRPEAVQGGIVWIEDRLVTGYPHAEGMPLLGAYDILRELEREGLLSRPDYYAKIVLLRASGAVFIPFEPDETLFHLAAAPIVDGQLVETPALTALRQNFAAAGRIEKHLKIGDNIAAAKGRPDEIEFPKTQMHLLSEALLAVWTSPGSFEERVARSDWLWWNMRVTQANRVMPGEDPDAAQDRFETMQLGHMLDKAIDVGGLLDRGRMARNGYLHWLWERALRQKHMADPGFLPRVGAYLAQFYKAILGDHFVGASADDRRIHEKLMMMRIQRLPEPVQIEVLSGGAFDGRSPLVKHITVAHRRFEPQQFWKAARAAWRYGKARVRTYEGKRVRLVRDGDTLILKGALRARLEDDILPIIAADRRDRADAARPVLAMLDLPAAEMEALLATLASAIQPHRIAEALASARKEAPSNRYPQIRFKLRQREGFDATFVYPPPYLRHASYLRLKADPAGLNLGPAVAELATTLPPTAALRRLWGIPVSLSSSLTDAMGEQDWPKLASTALTPIAIAQLASLRRRAGAEAAEIEALVDRFLEAAERVGPMLLSILRWTMKAQCRDAEWRAGDAGLQLALSWAHAERLADEFLRADLSIPHVIEYFDASHPPITTPDLLASRQVPADRASPETLHPGVLVYHCLGEIFGDASLEDVLTSAQIAKVRELTTVKIGEGLGPSLQLVLRSPVAPDAMGSFLGAQPVGLFPDDKGPSAARDALIDGSLDAIETEDEEQATAPQIFALASGAMSERQQERFEQIFETIDLFDFAFGHGDVWVSRWRAMLTPMVHVDRAKAERRLYELATASRDHFAGCPVAGSSEEPGSAVAAVAELIECSCVIAAAAEPAQQLASFCSLIEQLVMRWPSAARYLRDLVENLLAVTPAGRAQPLWGLRLFLRSYP